MVNTFEIHPKYADELPQSSELSDHHHSSESRCPFCFFYVTVGCLDFPALMSGVCGSNFTQFDPKYGTDRHEQVIHQRLFKQAIVLELRQAETDNNEMEKLREFDRSLTEAIEQATTAREIIDNLKKVVLNYAGTKSKRTLSVVNKSKELIVSLEAVYNLVTNTDLYRSRPRFLTLATSLRVSDIFSNGQGDEQNGKMTSEQKFSKKFCYLLAVQLNLVKTKSTAEVPKVAAE